MQKCTQCEQQWSTWIQSTNWGKHMGWTLAFLRAALITAVYLTFPHAIAGLDEGLSAYKTGDFKTAVTEFQALSEEGDPYAQFLLGEMYANGKGLEQDYKQAAELTHKSAEQGFADAQLKLGAMYTKGLGVDQNYHEAAKWYELASQHSDIDSHFRDIAVKGLVGSRLTLADIYANGRGVKQDYEQAVSWYRLAAEQNKNAEAQLALGLMYLQGKGITQDFNAALQLFREAALQGNMNAQNNLGSMYATGQAGKQDYHEAIYWYRKAAEQGHAKAQLNLGVSYANGLGVQRDEKEASRWYSQAAQQGDADAKERLNTINNTVIAEKTDVVANSSSNDLEFSLLNTIQKEFSKWWPYLLGLMAIAFFAVLIKSKGGNINFLIYFFWLIVSILAAVLVEKILSPSQVIYTIAIYFLFIILFGIQKKTYVKKSSIKVLKWDVYAKFELIEQSHILGIPLGSGTVLEVQRELLSDKEVSEFVIGKLLPLAFHLLAPKVALANRLSLKKK